MAYFVYLSYNIEFYSKKLFLQKKIKKNNNKNKIILKNNDKKIPELKWINID